MGMGMGKEKGNGKGKGKREKGMGMGMGNRKWEKGMGMGIGNGNGNGNGNRKGEWDMVQTEEITPPSKRTLSYYALGSAWRIPLHMYGCLPMPFCQTRPWTMLPNTPDT